MGLPVRARLSLSSVVKARHSGPESMAFVSMTSPQFAHATSPRLSSRIASVSPQSGQGRCSCESWNCRCFSCREEFFSIFQSSPNIWLGKFWVYMVPCIQCQGVSRCFKVFQGDKEVLKRTCNSWVSKGIRGFSPRCSSITL